MNPTRRKLATLTRDQRDNLYRAFFDTPDSNLLLEDIKESAFCYQTTAAILGHDQAITMDIDMKIREGMRLLALLIESRATKPLKLEEENSSN